MKSCDFAWPRPPAHLKLAPHVIHIWCFCLKPSTPVVDALAERLHSNERARADRFHFDRDRRRFIVAHGVLRGILGCYAHRAPAELQFRYGPRGKPALAMACGGDRLHFNLTHSHELGLCAVARNEELGVDVEWMRPLDDLHALARFVFSAHEYGRFCALHERQKLAAFYSCWTHKEAYLKAGGDGFVIPPDQFDVMPIPGAPSGVAGMGLNRVAPRDWFLQACSPAPGYVGAVAVPGQAWQAEGWQWTEHNAPPSIDL